MYRTARALLSSTLAASVILAPSAAGASDTNTALATNRVDGATVVDVSVQYRKAANGRVDEENRAYAVANCVDCQTFAAAFQLVLVTKDWDLLVPHNEAFAANVACDSCVTWASAKQVLVETGGPASLSENGRARLRALENRLRGLEADLAAGLPLSGLWAEVDAAYAELIAIGREEVVRDDGEESDAKVVAARSS